MNSGCYGNDISKVLRSINVIDINECKEKKLNEKKLNFFIEGQTLPGDLIITSVTLKGKIGKKNILKKTK